MKFVIPSNILGANHSLLVHNDQAYEQYSPFKDIDNNFIDVGSISFQEKMKMYGCEVPTFPPENIRKSYDIFTQNGNVKIPWKSCIPPDAYETYLKEYIGIVSKAVNTDFKYYDTIFSSGQKLFDELCPAVIDVEKYDLFLSEGNVPIASKAILRSFAPNNKGYSQNVEYSRTNTKTGRLVVTSGPQILHLKTSYRQIIKSRFNNGSVFYLDYKSLEPRVLLANKNINEKIPKDIYSHTIQELNLDGLVDRAHVKMALISTINGAGEHEICRQLEGKIDYPLEFIKAIKEHFGIEALKEKLTQEYNKNNGKMIYNQYGRPILCDKTAPYVLVNYYIQSTAVDVAILGFNKIWNKIKEIGATEYCKPIFVLHDALILDIHPDIKPHLEKIANLGTKIPNFETNKFWLEVQRLEH